MSSKFKQFKKRGQDFLGINSHSHRLTRVPNDSSKQRLAVGPPTISQTGNSDEQGGKETKPATESPRNEFDSLPPEKRCIVLEKHLGLKSKELTDLQSKYHELESRSISISDQRKDLESTSTQLQTRYENLDTSFRKALDDIKRLSFELRDLKAEVQHLYTRLGGEDQVYIDRNGRQATWILRCCVTQLDQNAKEKQENRKRFQDLKDSHQIKTATMESLQLEQNNSLQTQHQGDLDRLQAEINRLEQGLLTNVDKFRPMSDGMLKAKFTMLKKSVSGLARCPPEHLNPDKVGDVLNRRDLVSTIPRKHWKFLLESAFWSILVEGLFLTPFSVFGAHGITFASTWHHLFLKGSTVSPSGYNWPVPDTASENWRSITFEALQRQIEGRSMMSTTDGDINMSYEINLRTLSEKLTRLLGMVSQDKPDAVRNVIDQACELAMDFGAQRCRLRLFSPELNEMVSRNAGSYEDVNNDNSLAISQGVVELAVAPGLRRTGDGRGYTFVEGVDIWPAAVYLSTS